MSAFVVDKNVIDAIMTFAVDNKTYFPYVNQDSGVADKIGQILWDENVRSVNFRYSDDDVSEQYKFERLEASPAQVAKYCSCLEYQSCETNDWTATAAFDCLHRIQCDLLKKLPGYEDAQWG